MPRGKKKKTKTEASKKGKDRISQYKRRKVKKEVPKSEEPKGNTRSMTFYQKTPPGDWELKEYIYEVDDRGRPKSMWG